MSDTELISFLKGVTPVKLVGS